MRRYELTVYYLDGSYEECEVFDIEQEESSYPTTKWLAYQQAKEIVEKIHNKKGQVTTYELERVL